MFLQVKRRSQSLIHTDTHSSIKQAHSHHHPHLHFHPTVKIQPTITQSSEVEPQGVLSPQRCRKISAFLFQKEVAFRLQMQTFLSSGIFTSDLLTRQLLPRHKRLFRLTVFTTLVLEFSVAVPLLTPVFTPEPMLRKYKLYMSINFQDKKKYVG